MYYIGTGLCILAAVLLNVLAFWGAGPFGLLAVIPLLVGACFQAIGLIRAYEEQQIQEIEFQAILHSWSYWRF